jgi:hypothetical protein
VATMKNNPELTHAELTKLIEDNYTPKESNWWTHNYPQLSRTFLTDTKHDLSTQMKP